MRVFIQEEEEEEEASIDYLTPCSDTLFHYLIHTVNVMWLCYW